MESIPPRHEAVGHQLKMGWIGEDGGRNSSGLCSKKDSWIPGPSKFPDWPTLFLRSIARLGFLGHPASVTGILCGFSSTLGVDTRPAEVLFDPSRETRQTDQ